MIKSISNLVEEVDLESFGKKKKKKKGMNMKDLEEALPDDKTDVSSIVIVKWYSSFRYSNSLLCNRNNSLHLI